MYASAFASISKPQSRTRAAISDVRSSTVGPRAVPGRHKTYDVVSTELPSLAEHSLELAAVVADRLVADDLEAELAHASRRARPRSSFDDLTR